MDVQRLVAILRDHLSGTTLTLPAAPLESQRVTDVFAAYLPGGQLVMTGVERVEDGVTYARVVGTGSSGGPFVGMTVTATFTTPGNTTELDLTANPTGAWTWQDSFPVLDGTVLPALPFSGVGFRLTSAPPSTGGPAGGGSAVDGPTVAVAAVGGLSFTGALSLAAPYDVLSWLLDGTTAPTLAGPVPVDKGVPLPDITHRVDTGVDLQLVELPYVELAVGATVRPGDKPAADGFLQIGTELDFTARGTKVPLPLTATFADDPTHVVLAFDVTKLGRQIDALLGDFAAMLDHEDYASRLKDVPLASLLTLKQVAIQLDLANRKVGAIRVTVGSTQPWPVLSETRTPRGSANALVTVEDIEIVIALLDPFGQGRRLGIALFGTAAVGATGKLVASATLPDFAFDLELAQGTTIDLTELIEHFVGPHPDIPALRVVAFELAIDRAAQTYSGEIAVDSDWTIPIGSTSLKFNEIAVGVQRTAGSTTAHIAGSLTIAGAYVAASWDIPGPLQISGTLPSVDLSALVADLSRTSLRSDFPRITLTNTQIYVERRSDGGYYLAAGTTVDRFGTFQVDFIDVKDETGWVIGFVLPHGFSLENISSALAPLSFISLSEAGLMYATVDDPNFAFRAFNEPHFTFPAQLPSAPPGARKGLQLFAKLALSGGPLGVIAKVLPGIDGLLLSASFPDDYAKSSFAAIHDKPFALIPGVVVFDVISVAFAPGQEQFTLHLDASFIVHGDTLKLSGDIAVSGAVVLLELRTATPWPNPFGIKGLTLDAMGVALAVGEELTLTLAGKVTIGQGNDAVTLEVATEFNTAEEGMPDVLLAKEVGTITLPEIVHTFTTSRLPDILNTISLTDFQLIVVANPVGWTDPLDQKHYQPGLAFGGELRFFGLDARFALQVDYARGVFASGQIDKPLSIHVLTIADATDHTKGPYVQLDTANSPYLHFSAALTLFELVSYVVQAELDNNGFLFAFTYSVSGLGGVSFRIALVDKKAFSLAAKVAFAISKLGPIRAGSYTLGSLKVDLALDAHFAVAADTSGNFSLSIGATFIFEGVALKLDDLTIHDKITSFGQLPKVFADNLAALLWDIAKSLLQDAKVLFQLIGKGVLAITADIAHILNHELHVAIADAARFLKSVAGAIDYAARDVARVLKEGFSALDHEVARALGAAGYAVEDVADAIGHAFSLAAEDVAKALRTAEYDLHEIATALRRTFGWEAERAANFFKDTWHEVDNAVHDALQAAGYVANEIADVMKKVFNWVDHVVDKVKHALNPKNW